MKNTLRACRRQGDRSLRLAKGRDSATEQFKDNPNDFCLNHSVNRAQQKSSCACHSGANSCAHGSACFLDAKAKMGNSGCSTGATSRMRLTTELATAAITVTQSSGNTRRSEMVVIDLPVPATPLINTFRGPESVLKKDVTT